MTPIHAPSTVLQSGDAGVPDIADTDIVVCVQGMSRYWGRFSTLVKPLRVNCTWHDAAVPIVDEETFLNPDIVKIVHDLEGNVLYTSRTPIPYAKGGFSKKLGAFRVAGSLDSLGFPTLVHRTLNRRWKIRRPAIQIVYATTAFFSGCAGALAALLSVDSPRILSGSRQ